ncbi:hypothetical protein M8J76_017367 [Diaphorina citri]|nr:hypothetical protein M8J76_017367 [Diaphorina citri]
MKKNKNPSENKETDKDDDIITIRNEISKIAEESNIIQLRELCDKLFEIVDIKLDDRETKMKISSLEERISELQDERNSMEVKIHNDEIRIRNLIEDNEEQINQYDETVLQKEKEIENFRTIVERLHKGKDDETSALQLKIEKAEQETNANRAYIKHLEDELKKLEDNKDGLLMTINGLQKTIDSLNKFERHDADIDKSMEEDDSAHDNASDESSFSFGQQLLIPRGMNENNYQLNFAQELELTSQSQHNKSRNAENDISSANNQEFERPKHQNHNGPHTELNSNTQSINQSGQTLLDKSAFHPVSNHPLDPEVEIFVPDISLSQDTNRIRLKVHKTDHHQYSRRKIDPLSSYGYPHSKQQQQQQQHHILKQDQYPKTSANLRKGQIGNTTIDLTTKSTNNTDVPSNLQNPTNNSSTQPSRTSLPQRQGNFSNMGHPAPPYTWNWNILPRAYLPLESMNNGHQEMMMFRNMNNLTMLPNFLYPPYLWTHPIANC